VLARFLTPEWFEELNRATTCPASADNPAEGSVANPAEGSVANPAEGSVTNPAEGSVTNPAEGSVTIQQVVTGAPDGEVAYVVRVSGGRVHATLGRAADTDVTIVEDYGTALALSRGEMSARAALLAGRIQIRGNTHALVAGLAAMQAVQAGRQQALARTSY